MITFRFLIKQLSFFNSKYLLVGVMMVQVIQMGPRNVLWVPLKCFFECCELVDPLYSKQFGETSGGLDPQVDNNPCLTIETLGKTNYLMTNQSQEVCYDTSFLFRELLTHYHPCFSLFY